MGSKKRQPTNIAPDREAAPAAPAAPRNWVPMLAVAVFATVWIGLAMWSSAGKSATFDEPLHLVSGYAALSQGDFRVDPSHPPLIRAWAALPLTLSSRPRPETGVINAMSGRGWLTSVEDTRLARRFLHDDLDADRELRRARFMIMLIGVGFGALIFVWTYQWLGLRAGIFALALYGLSPNTIAHGSLVTTDLGGAAFMFGAVYFLWRLTGRWSAFNAAGLAFMVAAAALAKFSSLMLAPVLVLLLAAAVWHKTAITARRAFILIGILSVTTFVAIWAAHGFRYEPSATAGWLYRLHEDPALIDAAPITARLIAWVDSFRLLPNAFTEGLLYCLATSAQPAYLLGQYSTDGWWYYFPVAFLVKTPVAILILFAAGIYYQARRAREDGLLNELFIIVPAIGFGVLAALSHINIGIRHLLPFYPFVFVLAAGAADRWLRSSVRYARPALVTALIVGVLDVATVYPRTLTFFNFAAGGPANGLAYLSDSNLDWGQHLKELKKWMDETGVRSINLAYFGQADPAYYKVDCTYLPGSPWLMRRVTSPPKLPGFVAISATVLSGVYLPPEWRLFYKGFHDRAPVATIGNTINVYWVEQWPESEVDTAIEDPAAERALGDGLLRAAHWPDLAVRHYRRYLVARPDDDAAAESLSQALISSGKNEEGLDVLRQLVARDERNIAARVGLTLTLLDNDQANEALEHAIVATQLLPGQAAAWRLYGRALELTGQPREAAAKFERAVVLDPASKEARADLERVRARLR